MPTTHTWKSANSGYILDAADYTDGTAFAVEDSVNVAANSPNVFTKGGPGDDALTASAGSNVLDGGFGSNFIVGASGVDGGRDTIFLDGTAGTT